MQIEVIRDLDWICLNHDALRRPDRIIDTIHYKMATLNDAFWDVHALVIKTPADTSIVPLCRWKDSVEVVGQFWSEGWDVAIPENHWDAVSGETGSFSMQYSRSQYPGMTVNPTEQAYLKLPKTGQCHYYTELFKTSDERRALRRALALNESVDIVMQKFIGKGEIDLLVELSVERIGSESYLLSDETRKSFVQVVEYLERIGSLRLMSYRMAGETVGIAFLMYDEMIETLTFLSGFYRKRLNNFGKYMYWSFVRLAEMVGAREIIALAPLSRIKSDMGYAGRPLFDYEFDTTGNLRNNTNHN